MGPLIPYSAADARTLFELATDHIVESACCDATSAATLALHAVGHASGMLADQPPALPKVLVLSGGDTPGLVAMARAAAEAIGLPNVVIPLPFLSEQGWQGKDLGDYITGFRQSAWEWHPNGVVVLAGLEALRVRVSKYSGSSASTRDQREGKASDVASMLSGLPVPMGDSADWSPRSALIVITTQPPAGNDADSLRDWGLSNEALTERVAAATWIDVPRAEGLIAERAVRAQLGDLVELYALYGYHLSIGPEIVRWATAEAATQRETPGAASRRIREGGVTVLLRLLAHGTAHRAVSLAPDDLPCARRARPNWKD